MKTHQFVLNSVWLNDSCKFTTQRKLERNKKKEASTFNHLFFHMCMFIRLHCWIVILYKTKLLNVVCKCYSCYQNVQAWSFTSHSFCFWTPECQFLYPTILSGSFVSTVSINSYVIDKRVELNRNFKQVTRIPWLPLQSKHLLWSAPATNMQDHLGKRIPEKT